MIEARHLAASQLARMRGMNAMYHRRFFTDVWLTVVVWLAALAAAEFGADRLYLALPFIALLGAVLTSFDASYLMFARHYAAALERYLNDGAGHPVLVAGELEDAYLFRLRSRKIVTIGRPFTWFGFSTAFFTLLGATGYGYGVHLGLRSLDGAGGVGVFVGGLGLLTLATLVAGLRWFVTGLGERRLTDILDDAFPAP